MKKELKKGWWKCSCGQENGKGFKLCQKCLKLKKLKLEKCPNCGKNTFVKSIFGSIYNSCFYENKKRFSQ